MRASQLVLGALLLLPVSAAADEPALPWDVRMPLRFGAGYTSMWGGSPGFSTSLAAVMIGGELQHTNLRPVLVLGFDAVVAKDDPNVTVIDKDTGKPSQGFPQSLFHVETGFGLQLGGPNGFSGSLTFAPGAVFIDIPGMYKQDPISTVGLGLAWRLEITPWFITMHRDPDEERTNPSFGDWALASLSFYALVRADWVEKNQGVFVSGGLGFDLGRLLIAPLIRRFF